MGSSDSVDVIRAPIREGDWFYLISSAFGVLSNIIQASNGQ